MITLKKISEENINLLNNLLQLYLHDVSLHFPIDLNSKTCKYEYDDLTKYIDNSNNYAYFFMDKDEIIGFTLIDSEDDSMVVQEMFILNNYKNKGLGEEAITKVFDEFKGNWIIRSLPCSPKSENFWKKTIERYNNNKYDIEYVGKFNRAVFRFNNNNE